MLEQISQRAADWLIAKGAAKEEDKDVYVYGLELSFSTISTIILILLFASIFTNTLYGIFYLLFMFPVRLFCGGYHATTHLNCSLCSNCLFLVSLAVVSLTPMCLFQPLSLGITILSGFYVFMNTPVENENQPLTAKKLSKNRYISRCFITMQGLLLLLGAFFLPHIASYVYMASLATGVVAILMLVAKLQKRSKEVKT